MSEERRDDVRLNVLPEGVGSVAPADEEIQNAHLGGDVDVDARSPLLSSGNGGGHGPRADPESLAEMEIKSRLWIKEKGNEVFREALETWQAKDKLFASRVDKKRKQSSSLRNEIYQLIGFYLVFQGVLMTAVAQSNYLTCHNWWTAFCLSLLASLVTVGGVIQKFRSVISLEMTIASEGYSRMLCINRVNKLLQKRERFSFTTDAKDPDENRPPPAQTNLWVSAVIVAVILLVFSSLFLASVRQILCDSGLSGSPLSAPSP